MFIDASALIAMMTDEDEARRLAVRMQASTTRMISPQEVAETAIGITAILGLAIEEASTAVRTFLQLANIQLLAVPPRAAFLAAEAFAAYGEGRHPANLSLAQCMTYACARYYRQPLLCRAEAFALTDIERA
jgi:ribonuclease VapC